MAVVIPGITWTRSTSVKTGLGTLGAVAESLTKATERSFDEQVAAGATVEVDIAVAVAKLHGVAIDATKNDTLTGNPTGLSVLTNSTTTPGNTIPITAGTAVQWLDLDPTGNNPITADVTKLFLKNTGTIAVRIRGAFLADAS